MIKSMSGMSMRGWGSVSAMALLAISAGSASADSLTAQEILSNYNLVTTGDV